MLDQQLARYVNRFRTSVSITAVRVLLPASSSLLGCELLQVVRGDAGLAHGAAAAAIQRPRLVEGRPTCRPACRRAGGSGSAAISGRVGPLKVKIYEC